MSSAQLISTPRSSRPFAQQTQSISPQIQRHCRTGRDAWPRFHPSLVANLTAESRKTTIPKPCSSALSDANQRTFPPTPPLCLAASPSRLSRSVGRSEILSQKATSALPWERGGGIAARARNPMEFEMADDSRKTQAWPLRPVKGAATPRGRQTDEVQGERILVAVAGGPDPGSPPPPLSWPTLACPCRSASQLQSAAQCRRCVW